MAELIEKIKSDQYPLHQKKQKITELETKFSKELNLTQSWGKILAKIVATVLVAAALLLTVTPAVMAIGALIGFAAGAFTGPGAALSSVFGAVAAVFTGAFASIAFATKIILGSSVLVGGLASISSLIGLGGLFTLKGLAPRFQQIPKTNNKFFAGAKKYVTEQNKINQHNIKLPEAKKPKNEVNLQVPNEERNSKKATSVVVEPILVQAEKPKTNITAIPAIQVAPPPVLTGVDLDEKREATLVLEDVIAKPEQAQQQAEVISNAVAPEREQPLEEIVVEDEQLPLVVNTAGSVNDEDSDKILADVTLVSSPLKM